MWGVEGGEGEWVYHTVADLPRGVQNLWHVKCAGKIEVPRLLPVTRPASRVHMTTV